MTKDEIRIRQKKFRKELPEKERERLCKQLQERLYQTEAYQKCETVFAFVSFGSEPDTGSIILRCFQDGKKVFVPRVEAHGMEFYRIRSLEGLIVSKFGVPEPAGSEDSRYQQDAIIQPYHKLMLLPGLAFDRSGNRIGYGAGYYDRYLSTHPETQFYKAALAFDFQVMDTITAEDYDIKADAIITPARFYNFRSI